MFLGVVDVLGARKMADMQDIEQQAYLELVQEILSCPQGEEQALLASRPEMVNEQLVEAMLAVAQMLQEQEQEGEESNAGWLQNFAFKVAKQIGLELDSDDDTSAQLRFLMEVFQSIDDSDVNPDVVYPLLRQNLDLLNDGMTDVLKAWVSHKFAEIDSDRQKSIAGTIGNFGNLIQQFPLGNKAVNMDLSIACYEIILEIFTVEEDAETYGSILNSLAVAYLNRIRGDRAENLEKSIACYALALEIYTKEDFPIDWAMTQNNLATAYRNRIRGDRAENLEKSIACYAWAL
jgi:tetratricopeptide (TPR) repeat protein